MWVYRITAHKYAKAPLSGQGAARAGGRWNPKGLPMGYTAGSRSLAILEMLVHLPRDTIPASMAMVPIQIADRDIMDVTDVPNGWDRPRYDAAVQNRGAAWARSGASLALRVPSAIVRAETNVLVNPAHPGFARIRIGPAEDLLLDPRFFGSAARAPAH